MRHHLAKVTLEKVMLVPNEPVFVLRAQDNIADCVVDFWADIMQQRHGKDHPKVIAARSIANDMRNHPTRKDPD